MDKHVRLFTDSWVPGPPRISKKPWMKLREQRIIYVAWTHTWDTDWIYWHAKCYQVWQDVVSISSLGEREDTTTIQHVFSYILLRVAYIGMHFCTILTICHHLICLKSMTIYHMKIQRRCSLFKGKVDQRDTWNLFEDE